jgi:hypothetical protein
MNWSTAAAILSAIGTVTMLASRGQELISAFLKKSKIRPRGRWRTVANTGGRLRNQNQVFRFYM